MKGSAPVSLTTGLPAAIHACMPPSTLEARQPRAADHVHVAVLGNFLGPHGKRAERDVDGLRSVACLPLLGLPDIEQIGAVGDGSRFDARYVLTE
jgi:hypothetical protein